MEYLRNVTLKDGRACTLRSAAAQDAPAALANFILTHGQTDFLLSYPDEIRFTEEQEAQLLQKKAESPREAELLAVVDGKVAGLAGIDPVGRAEKLRHRCTLGVSIDKAFWGLGIGRALTTACVECAKKAGYTQLELEVVEDNAAAVNLYRSLGFTEYGRNPAGFCARETGVHALLLMRLPLNV